MRKIIIWDWDNTLADTFPITLKCYEQLCLKHGFKMPSKIRIKGFMNHHTRDALALAFPRANSVELQKEWVQMYAPLALKGTLMSGAEQILKWAHDSGYTNILASNKLGKQLRKEVDVHHLTHYFNQIIGCGDLPFNKPAKEYGYLLLKGFRHPKVFVVGDGASDMMLANAIHATSILVNPKPNPIEFRETYVEYVVPRLAEVSTVLNKING